MSLKASDFVRVKKESENLSISSYKVQLEKCLVHLRLVFNTTDDNSIFYNVPTKIWDNPYYKLNECIQYMKKELKEREFFTKVLESDASTLWISWDMKYIEAIQKEKELQLQKELQLRNEQLQQQQDIQLKWNPHSAISDMNIKTSLMKSNPKYSHLKSINSLKNTTKSSKKR